MRRLLRRLRDQGIRVAVVTSKQREDSVAELAATGLDESVELLIAFEDTEEHKPAAAPQLEALCRLGADGGVGVGDLPSDVLSARAAGLSAFAVSWGYGEAEALRDAGAEQICETPDELERCLAQTLQDPRRG